MTSANSANNLCQTCGGTLTIECLMHEWYGFEIEVLLLHGGRLTCGYGSVHTEGSISSSTDAVNGVRYATPSPYAYSGSVTQTFGGTLRGRMYDLTCNAFNPPSSPEPRLQPKLYSYPPSTGFGPVAPAGTPSSEETDTPSSNGTSFDSTLTASNTPADTPLHNGKRELRRFSPNGMPSRPRRNEPRSYCGDCGKSFSRFKDLQRHQDDIHGLSKYLYVCTHRDCLHMRFSRKDKMREHCRTMKHSGFKCYDVNEVFEDFS